MYSLQRPYNGRNIYPVLNIATSAWWHIEKCALIETQQPTASGSCSSKVPTSGFLRQEQHAKQLQLIVWPLEALDCLEMAEAVKEYVGNGSTSSIFWRDNTGSFFYRQPSSFTSS